MEKNKENKQIDQIVIDAKNGIVGRIASFAAKQSLLGKNVVILNCSKALLTGRKRMIVQEYGAARRRGGTSLNGPHFPKSAERLMKRTIRGMLSYTQERGLKALKRIMCFENIPSEFESTKKISLETETKSKTLSVGSLSRDI